MATHTLNDDLTAAITWALDRIIRNEFKEARDDAGNIDSMVLDRDFGPVNPVHSEAPLHRAGRGGSHGHGPSPAAHAAISTSRYAMEFRNLFPDMMRRSGTLPAVPAARELPEYVKRFLVEASRCLLYGQFLAALFLCRSALSEAVVVTLRKKGYAQDLAGIKEDGLKGIFRVAHDKGILDSAQLLQAEEIRVLANRAIHGAKPSSEAECMNAFAATVGIVRALAA